MYKTFKYIIFLLILQQNTARSMDSIKDAEIQNGIISSATHYHLIRGGKTMVWDRTLEPVEVWNNPQAFFYGYNIEQKNKPFLGAVTIKEIDSETIKNLNKLVDPQAKLPTLKKAVITHCMKRGRVVWLYDDHHNVVEECSHYTGSIDIKQEEDNMSLIKPHSLLADLEEVEETTSKQNWILALILPSYVKEIVKYK